MKCRERVGADGIWVVLPDSVGGIQSKGKPLIASHLT
jgi:hypothetical protein